MKKININGKEYILEFTIEASLYNDCTEKITNLMLNSIEASDKEDLKEMVSSMSDIPQTTLTMFYAGLLEHHGKDGDGSVLNLSDAKDLIKSYCKEHSDDETGNFYGIMELLLEVMYDDGFFKQIGLEQMMKQTEVKAEQVKKKSTRKKTEKVIEK